MEIVARLVLAGAPQGELSDLVEGVAELMRRGDAEIRWWYPANLFGSQTCDRWRGQVAEFRASQERLRRADAERAAYEDRARAEAQATAQSSPGIHSLEVHRLARDVLERFGAARSSSDGRSVPLAPTDLEGADRDDEAAG